MSNELVKTGTEKKRITHHRSTPRDAIPAPANERLHHREERIDVLRILFFVCFLSGSSSEVASKTKVVALLGLETFPFFFKNGTKTTVHLKHICNVRCETFWE